MHSPRTQLRLGCRHRSTALLCICLLLPHLFKQRLQLCLAARNCSLPLLQGCRSGCRLTLLRFQGGLALLQCSQLPAQLLLLGCQLLLLGSQLLLLCLEIF